MTQTQIKPPNPTTIQPFVSLNANVRHLMPANVKVATHIREVFRAATIDRPAVFKLTFLSGETREIIVTSAQDSPDAVTVTGLMPNGHRLVSIQARFPKRGGGSLTIVK